jgi:hypothetical protein
MKDKKSAVDTAPTWIYTGLIGFRTNPAREHVINTYLS